MSDALIEITDLAFAVDDKPILRQVSLTVQAGEYVSIVGPNGAGKTTLIKCLGRIHRGWTGSIRIAGRPLQAYGQKELARMLSYVPQAEGRSFPFTVEEFVLLARYPHLSPFTSVRAADRAAVADALAVTGVAELKDRALGTLSGGERQMVFVAAALAQGARILLLDEPATFLDYRHQADVMRLLKRVNRESGITILSVNHNINSAAIWSDRIMAIKGGHSVFYGPPRDILRRDVLEEIYETPFQFIEHPESPIPLAIAEGVS